MNYDEIVLEIESLSYRDKLRLAQLLIQAARKEEEEQNPKKRVTPDILSSTEPETIRYVAERLWKLKPSKKSTLFNSISAMFQFQGGISDQDIDVIFSELLKKNYLSMDQNNRIKYPGD